MMSQPKHADTTGIWLSEAPSQGLRCRWVAVPEWGRDRTANIDRLVGDYGQRPSRANLVDNQAKKAGLIPGATRYPELLDIHYRYITDA